MGNERGVKGETEREIYMYIYYSFFYLILYLKWPYGHKLLSEVERRVGGMRLEGVGGMNGGE